LRTSHSRLLDPHFLVDRRVPCAAPLLLTSWSTGVIRVLPPAFSDQAAQRLVPRHEEGEGVQDGDPGHGGRNHDVRRGRPQESFEPEGGGEQLAHQQQRGSGCPVESGASPPVITKGTRETANLQVEEEGQGLTQLEWLRRYYRHCYGGVEHGAGGSQKLPAAHAGGAGAAAGGLLVDGAVPPATIEGEEAEDEARAAMARELDGPAAVTDASAAAHSADACEDERSEREAGRQPPEPSRQQDRQQVCGWLSRYYAHCEASGLYGGDDSGNMRNAFVSVPPVSRPLGLRWP
jgi:hypothetical protein